MTLRTFETKQAKYHLALSNHVSSAEHMFDEIDLGSIDAVVLEDAGSFGINVDEHIQYGGILKNIRKHNEKYRVFGVDVHLDPEKDMLGNINKSLSVMLGAAMMYDSFVKGTSTRREFLGNIFEAAIGTAAMSEFIALLASYMKEEPFPGSTLFISAKTISLSITNESLRDAVSAKKISEYVAKKVSVCGKKPNIAIVYGAMHAGIEQKILFPAIADATISLWQHLGKLDEWDWTRIVQLREYVFDGMDLKSVYGTNCEEVFAKLRN